MFANLKNNIEFINMTNFQADKLEIINDLFYDFENLSILDISNFKAPLIKGASRLFEKCINLKSIYFGNYFISNNIDSFIHCFMILKILFL